MSKAVTKTVQESLAWLEIHRVSADFTGDGQYIGMVADDYGDHVTYDDAKQAIDMVLAALSAAQAQPGVVKPQEWRVMRFGDDDAMIEAACKAKHNRWALMPEANKVHARAQMAKLLAAALSAGQAPPVAWLSEKYEGKRLDDTHVTFVRSVMEVNKSRGYEITPLYLHPPVQVPVVKALPIFPSNHEIRRLAELALEEMQEKATTDREAWVASYEKVIMSYRRLALAKQQLADLSLSAPAVPGEVETAQDFTPGIVENTEAGISALVIKDGPTVTGQEMTVRPLLGMETRQIVGFQWDIPFPASPEQGEKDA